MQDISKGEGRTVLFVSHNMELMARLCRRGILLDHGTVEYSGEINDVISYYLNNNLKFKAHYKEENIKEGCYVCSVELSKNQGELSTNFNFNDDIELVFYIKKETNDADDYNLSFAIINTNDLIVLSSSYKDSNSFTLNGKNKTFKATINGNLLNKGDYIVRLFFLMEQNVNRYNE